MKAWGVLFMGIWPGIVFGQWVQVGFTDIRSDAPGSVIVSNESGSWERELKLRSRYDIRRECIVSDPLVLPRHASEGTFSIRWEQGGLAFSYEFKPVVGKPMQILLDDRKPSGPEKATTQSSEFELSLAPNPFNPLSTLSMNLPEAAHLRLEVFDILGRSVHLLADGQLPPGTHQWRLDGSSWSSGTYFLSYRLSPGQSGVRRLVLLK